MEQLKKILASLSWKQRISTVLVAILFGAGLLAVSHWRRESDFKPLYNSLSQEDAGAIVQKLKEGNTEYRLSETSGTISVPSARVAELRLEMAAAGLPRTGRIGFELFDKSNFGATEFVEHINYRRALEGELERSVMALSEVERARVHLTFPKDSVFLESRQPAKASVMVKLHPGSRLSPQNVTAIAHLVGSAVEGLAPEAVSVLDMQGNLLSRPRKEGEDEGSAGMLDFRRSIEKDILAKISSTLEPLLGAEKFRAGVSVECDATSGEQSEEIYDPSKSVMISSQKSEDSGGPGALAAGVPGTASNLPRAAARPAGGQSTFSRRTETVAYQSSRTVRKTLLPRGTVKRVSVSVLLDQTARWEKQGGQTKLVLVPPSPEVLKSVRDIVAAISGFDQQRGDQIIIETLPFESTRNLEPPQPQTPPAPAPTRTPADAYLRDPKVLVGAGAAVLLIVVLAAGSMLLRRKNGKIAGHVQVSGPPALAASGAGEDQTSIRGAAADDARKELESALSERAALQDRMDAEVLKSLKVPPVATKKTEVLAKEIKESIKKDSATSAQILRTWLQQH